MLTYATADAFEHVRPPRIFLSQQVKLKERNMAGLLLAHMSL